MYTCIHNGKKQEKETGYILSENFKKEVFMNTKVIGDILSAIDDVVWGPIMLILLVGTGIFLTIRTRALCIRNLPYAIKSVLSKEARQKTGEGDVSPFSALTTALAATMPPPTR